MRTDRNIDDAVNHALDGERVVVDLGGGAEVAVVPMDDLDTLADLDLALAELAAEALADDPVGVPAEEFLRSRGL
jgi:hypothetical protein